MILAEAQFSPSPNFDERPDGEQISLLVIHNISLPPGEFAGDYVQAFFANKLNCSENPYFATIAHLQLSSHFYIRRDGALWQFVALHQRAWHAGQSCFQGQADCNNFSIGIELEGTDNLAYAAEQYNMLANLTKKIMRLYPAITLDRIVGHADIAPGRKTDPGPAFDWALYKELVLKG